MLMDKEIIPEFIKITLIINKGLFEANLVISKKQ